MEFNLNTKRWAGDLYHRLESICQEVDGLVNKDTMKSVGSQVQNVGITAKKLYSDVVQDMLPLSGDIVKPKRQSAAGEKGDMQGHVSVTVIRPASTHTEKQLQKNKISNDHKMQILNPASTPESETCQHLRDNDNAIVQNSEDNNIAEKTIAKDLKSMTTHSSFDIETFSREFDEDCISSSPVFSAHEKVSTSIEKEENQNVDEGFADDTMCPETSSTGWLSKSMLSVFEDLSSEENRSLSSKTAPVSTHKVNQANYSVMDSPLPLACDANDWLLEKDTVLSESCYTKPQSFEWPTSHQLSEARSYYSYNEKEQTIMPSTGCTSPNFPISVESTSGDFSKKAENVLHTHSVSDGSTSHVSAASSKDAADVTKEATSADFSKEAGNDLHSHSVSDCCFSNISATTSLNAADTMKALDVDPFFPILESNDDNALQTNGSAFLIGSSENKHDVHYKDGPLKSVMSSSEIENTYAHNVPIGDLDLESVHLTPNSKHDRRSVVLNSKFSLVGSYRRRNFKYYKNLIKDTFTSQKRLSKEYEHLGIMHDDIDAKSNQHFEPSSLSSFLNTALPVARTQSSQDIDQWELL